MRTLLHKNFQNLINNARKVSNDTFLMFHPKRLEKYSESKCYDGYLNCGPMCLAVHKLLKDNNIESRVFKARSGLNDFSTDHVFIYSNQKLIDPTYKQFLRDTRGEDDTYQKFIYEDLDKFFIGEISNLTTIYQNAKLVNQITYKDYNLVDLEDLNYYWINPIDVTHKFDRGLALLQDTPNITPEEDPIMVPYLI